MALIEPVKQDATNPGAKRYPASLRWWHWLNFIVITGSLITVLINSTVLKARKSAPGVQKELLDAGTPITAAQAKTAVHYLGDKVWEVHTYFGFCLAALLLFRLVSEFFQVTDQKFINRFKKAYRQYKAVTAERQKGKHDVIVKWLYTVFYLMLLVMAATGLSMAFEDDLAFLKPVSHLFRNIHSFTMYLILGFIVIHITGVLLAERKPEEKGIVSDMINGG